MPDTHLVTAEELLHLPRDDRRYELVAGRLIRMSPVGGQHGTIVVQLILLIGGYVREKRLGQVFTEVGFIIAANPDTVRAPDVAFVRRESVGSTPLRGFWNGAPDLAVEVLSPEDRPSEVREKIEEYLAGGVEVVVVVDPDGATLDVHRRGEAVLTLGIEDELDLGDVVAGFRCRVREVFE
jgi:Uma2 family endonuclease